MPVTKRIVEPVYVCRGSIPKGVKNELEAVTINTMSSVILQLSALAKHAEDIFGELFVEAGDIYKRACNAQERIERLNVKITQLDSAGEEISLQDINMQKAFKMTIHSDQQVVSRETLPNAMMQVYESSDPVPDLNRLNVFRSDGKVGLKFYTNPSYFFELWIDKMSKELESRKKKKKKAHKGKRDQKKKVKEVRMKERAKNVPEWELSGTLARKISEPAVIRPPSAAPPTPDHLQPAAPALDPTNLSPSPGAYSTRRTSSINSSRPTTAPPPPPGTTADDMRSPSVSPPPPPPSGVPPPPPMSVAPVPPAPPSFAGDESGMPPPPPISINDMSSVSPSPPPPPSMPGVPPPPPPPSVNAPPPPPPPGVPPPPVAAMLTKATPARAPPPPKVEEADPRCDFLSAIRKGMELKKVQEHEVNERKKEKAMPMDVASILARRIHMELSDSDDDSEYDSDDDDGWDTDD